VPIHACTAIVLGYQGTNNAPEKKSLVTFQHMLRNKTRNLTFKVQITIGCLNIQERKLLVYQAQKKNIYILKSSYTTTQTTITEILTLMQQKEEIYKISNKKQRTITKSIITKADHTKQILIMQYVEYINIFKSS